MKALFDAIFAHYAATDLTPVLYNTEADDEAVFPYVVLQLVSGTAIDFASGKTFTENWLIQFNLFDKSADMSALLEVYADLITAFDLTTLTIAGHAFKSCVREGALQTKVEKVWQINVMYRVKARVT